MSTDTTNDVVSARKCAWLLMVATVLLAQNAEEVKDYVSHSVDGNTILITCEGTHKVRLDMCLPDMVRVDFDPAGQFHLVPVTGADNEGGRGREWGGKVDLAPHLLDKQWTPVSINQSDAEDHILFQTGELSIRVYKSPFRIHFYDASNSKLINKDYDSRGMKCSTGGMGSGCLLHLQKEKSASEHFFGFGNGNRGFNDEYTCDHTGFFEGANPDGWHYKGMKTSSTPFFYSTDGYGLFMVFDGVAHTRHDEQIDLGMTSPDYYSISYSRDAQEYKQYLMYYFIYGPSWSEVIYHYTDLTGRAPVYRKKYFGVAAVHRCGSSKSGTADEGGSICLEDAANRYRSERYPLDLYIAEGGGDAARGWWGFFIDDPAYMGNGHYWFPKAGHTYWNGECQNDIELMEFFHQRGFIVGANQVHGYHNKTDSLAAEYIVDHGFDVHWRDLMSGGRHHTHSKIVFDNFLGAFDGDSSRTFIRQGWATWVAQKYGPFHVGDMNRPPNFMKAELAITLGGYPYSHIDLGVDEWWCVGHSLLPMPFYHASGTGRTPQPWTHEGREDRQNNYRKWMRFHESMVPYLYSYGCRSSIDGMPVWRHMMTADPKNPATWDKDYQAYVGEWLLHAPKNGKNFSGDDVSVWIPEGTWYDWFKGTKYTGEKTITYNVAGYQLPLFAKQGAIIPVGPEMDYIGEIPEDPLTLKIWPHGNTEFELWEDATPVKTTFRCNHSASQTAVVIPGFPGSRWSPADRRYQLEVHAIDKPQIVRCNSTDLAECSSHSELQGKSAGWYFDDAYPEGKCFVKPGAGGASRSVVYLSYDGNIDPVQTRGSGISPNPQPYTLHGGPRSCTVTFHGDGFHRLRLMTPQGRLVTGYEGAGRQHYQIPLDQANGIYLLDMAAGDKRRIMKVYPGMVTRSP